MALDSTDIKQIARVFMGMFRNEISDIMKDVVASYITEGILTTKDVAKLLGKTEAAIRKRCEKGHIPGHKDNYGVYYFSKKEIYDYFIGSDRNLNVRKSTKSSCEAPCSGKRK